MDVVAGEAFNVGLVATAFTFGLRHGVDWDHIAAITDITSSQHNRRRSMVLSTLYIVGHALVVLVLGIGAIAAGARLPGGVDTVMERVVGVTLILLAAYVLWGLARQGSDFRLRSRWMLVVAGVRRGVRKLRRPSPAPVTIEHEHEHPVDEPHALEHRHAHEHIPAAAGRRAGTSSHRHTHRHAGTLPDDPFVDYGRASAFGVGLLHGVGAETPTQVLIFLTAAGVQGIAAGLLLLGCFLTGLLVSNTAIALGATFGFVGTSKRWWLYATVSVVTALFSLLLGILLLLGKGSAVPAIFGG